MVDSMLWFSSETPVKWKKFWSNKYKIKPREFTSVLDVNPLDKRILKKDHQKMIKSYENLIPLDYINKPRPNPKIEFQKEFNHLLSSID